MEAVGLGKMSTGVSLRDPCKVLAGMVGDSHDTPIDMQITPMHKSQP